MKLSVGGNPVRGFHRHREYYSGRQRQHIPDDSQRAPAPIGYVGGCGQVSEIGRSAARCCAGPWAVCRLTAVFTSGMCDNA